MTLSPLLSPYWIEKECLAPNAYFLKTRRVGLLDIVIGAQVAFHRWIGEAWILLTAAIFFPTDIFFRLFLTSLTSDLALVQMINGLRLGLPPKARANMKF